MKEEKVGNLRPARTRWVLSQRQFSAFSRIRHMYVVHAIH